MKTLQDMTLYPGASYLHTHYPEALHRHAHYLRLTRRIARTMEEAHQYHRIQVSLKRLEREARVLRSMTARSMTARSITIAHSLTIGRKN